MCTANFDFCTLLGKTIPTSLALRIPSLPSVLPYNIAVVVKLRTERKKNRLENWILLVLSSTLAGPMPVPGKTISYRASGK